MHTQSEIYLYIISLYVHVMTWESTSSFKCKNNFDIIFKLVYIVILKFFLHKIQFFFINLSLIYFSQHNTFN